jgi:hypothetical protein
MRIKRFLTRMVVASTVVVAIGAAFPQSASAVGCDHQVGPVSYGDDTKPPDICVTAAGVGAEVTGQYQTVYGAGETVFVGPVFELVQVYADTGPAFVENVNLVCAGSECGATVAKVSNENGGIRVQAAVCTLGSLGNDCKVDEDEFIQP